jgi:5'(3')-deoxyribonucleotidase
LDGVVCEYDIPKLVKNFFGVDISKYIISAYDIADFLGVSSIAVNTMFKEQVFGKPNFIEGSIETLKEWESKGHELVIFSNRTKYMGYNRLAEWLMIWKVPFSGIDGGKGEYDIQIDDYPKKLRDTNSKLKLLFDQPWNRECKNIENALKRVYNWQDIKREVSNV